MTNSKPTPEVNPLQGVCCHCDFIYREGILIDGCGSHGHCDRCHDIVMELMNIDFEPELYS